MTPDSISVCSDFPRAVREIENTWIALADGCRLAARIWLPTDAAHDPVPAILEYLPYRKRDGTVVRDALTHPYVAGHGYACVRVDMRGNGDSEGLMFDEYTRQEQDDALEVIDWLVAQPWCSGTVGMMGISWGGFNSLQVAARRPDALKAIIPLCFTDDRYADDIHYKGGTLLLENLGWAATMFAYSSRPPDPLIVGERWRKMWQERLDNTPLLIDHWLTHPHRDEYWKHGSVCENPDAVEAAVLAVGGWHDAYSNAVPRTLAWLRAPARAIIGPWAHKYPHVAVPGPRIDFLHEALRWWDHWLKGADRAVMDDPAYRFYVMDAVRPRTHYEHRAGNWSMADTWPPADCEQRSWHLNATGLEPQPTAPRRLTVSSPEDTGVMGGELCIIWLGPEWPADQRRDDAGSLVFDSEPLASGIEIAGAPAVELELAVDRPQANIAVRLCDVWPDGASTRITYGVLNLAHRDSHERPEALVPGARYRVRIQLDDIACRVPQGHRLRVAISTAYWPLVWPAPEPATLSLFTAASVLHLPARSSPEESAVQFARPQGAAPLATETLREAAHSRTVRSDLADGTTTVTIIDDFGRTRIPGHGLITDAVARERYTIRPDDPLSAVAEIHWSETLSRGDWCVSTETRTRMWSDSRYFHIDARLEAYEQQQQQQPVFSRRWQRRIERRFN